MDSVYQDTLCLQPLIIATQHPPRLIELAPSDPDPDGSGLEFGGSSGLPGSAGGSEAPGKGIQGVNYQSLEYGQLTQ